MEPLYVAQSSGRRAIYRTLAILSAVTIAFGAVLYFIEPDARELVLIDVPIFVALYAFIYFILPVRYEVGPDRLRVVFTGSRNWDLRFETIAWARAARWWEAYGYFGLRFAANPRTAVVVQRVRPGYFSNWNIVISPHDRDEFLRELGGAMEAHRAPV